MKFYLAARYSRAAQMREVRAFLVSLGHTVTSRWIDGGHELTREGSKEAAHAERVRFAQEDLADLLEAESVIAFTEEPRQTNTRGGRHVEFGAALVTQKRCLVVGPRENVFYCLPQVIWFSTWEECRRMLADEAERRAA